MSALGAARHLLHYEFEREPFFLLRSVVVDTAEELVLESPRPVGSSAVRERRGATSSTAAGVLDESLERYRRAVMANLTDVLLTLGVKIEKERSQP